MYRITTKILLFRFGGGKIAEKKQIAIDKLMVFFERFLGIGDSSFKVPEKEANMYEIGTAPTLLVVEIPAVYGTKWDD